MRKAILEEVKACFLSVSDNQIQTLVDQIIHARHIIIHGKGRVGLMMKAFAMRLSQLGFYARVIGDITMPAIKKGDLLIIGNLSGFPSSSSAFFEIARKNCAYSIAFTANPTGPVNELADYLIVIYGRTMNIENNMASLQPMCSTIEQTLLLVLDYIALILAQKNEQNELLLRNRHANLQ